MLSKLFGKAQSANESVDKSVTAPLQSALQTIIDPNLNQSLAELDVLKSAKLEGDVLKVELEFSYPTSGLVQQYQQQIAEAVNGQAGIASVDLVLSCNIESVPTQEKLPAMAGVKNIIAVASGKGGVGKSTTTVNLALAAAAEGARVGILDADIYGPSLAQMMGVADGTRPGSSEDEKFFIPIEKHGVQTMSMAYLVDEDTPMVWRGPMVSGAMQQLLQQTQWTDLDYLFIDMPPGTGDIQLTLSQKVPVSGAAIVTTPQDIALLDAVKGVEMFDKVGIPVLGIVENMSVHICSNCGHSEHIFGAGGGEKIAAKYNTTVLGSLPLAMNIRQQADSGLPAVIADSESEASALYRQIARKMTASLAKRVKTGSAGAVPSISISDD